MVWFTAVLIFFTAAISIIGDTTCRNESTNKKQLTGIGKLAVIFAVVTLISSGINIYSVEEAEKIRENLAYSELFGALDEIRMELKATPYIILNNGQSNTKKIVAACKAAIDIVTRHANYGYPNLTHAITLLRNTCRILKDGVTAATWKNEHGKIKAVQDDICLHWKSIICAK